MSDEIRLSKNDSRGHVVKGLILISVIVSLALAFRFLFSFLMILLVAVLLLIFNLVLLYRIGEKWLASLMVVSIAFTVLGFYSGYKLATSSELANEIPQPPIQLAEYTSIYIAAKDISKGTVIHDYMYIETRLPIDMVVESYFLDSDDIVGRETLFDIRRGTILTKPLLIELMPVPTSAISEFNSP